MKKKPIGIDVLTATKQRIAWVFDNFPRVYVSFSGGKDSSAMLHLVMEEAQRRKRKVGILFVDLEGQYKLTIDHIVECYELYRENSEPFWVALPIHLRNAVSQYQHHWICWDPDAREAWVRTPPEMSITDEKFFPFFKRAMEFEEFVPAFGKWYGGGKLTACFVGIRTDESLNRWRTITGGKKQCMDGRTWTTWCGETLFNVYPIYDWKTRDVWIYAGKSGKPYNRLYDYMHRAGMTIHQMRICQPYGDDQRKGLWLFHLIEPETWSRIVARVNGANAGAMYANETGNILGIRKISRPPGHTWESFAKLLLGSMPPATQEHFRNKVAVFLRWWQDRGYSQGIPDEATLREEADRKAPSWRRICKALLRNDYWCKGLSFSQHKSEAYEKYLKIMKKRRQRWKLPQLT